MPVPADWARGGACANAPVVGAPAIRATRNRMRTSFVGGGNGPPGIAANPKYSVAFGMRPLRGPHATPISAAIEFRPNDLALPRSTRLTDDLPKISRQPGPCLAWLSDTYQ